MLTTSRGKLAYIVVKAREFDAQVATEGLEEGSNAADDLAVGILEDTPDNPTQGELIGALENLNEDEMNEVLELVWIGHGDFTGQEWPQARAAARQAHDERAVSYLLQTPNVGDLLEQGLTELGLSITDEEARL